MKFKLENQRLFLYFTLSNQTQKRYKAMTELVIKVEDSLAKKFKEISFQKFKGDDALTFEFALKSLLSKDDLDMLRLEQIVEQIQDEIEANGGITDEEIDGCIAAYRRPKRVRQLK